MLDRVGASAPARFLCITEKYSLSEIRKVSHTIGNSFQYFGFVVAAFNISVCPGNIHCVDNLLKPVVVCLCISAVLYCVSFSIYFLKITEKKREWIYARQEKPIIMKMRISHSRAPGIRSAAAIGVAVRSKNMVE